MSNFKITDSLLCHEKTIWLTFTCTGSTEFFIRKNTNYIVLLTKTSGGHTVWPVQSPKDLYTHNTQRQAILVIINAVIAILTQLKKICQSRRRKFGCRGWWDQSGLRLQEVTTPATGGQNLAQGLSLYLWFFKFQVYSRGRCVSFSVLYLCGTATAGQEAADWMRGGFGDMNSMNISHFNWPLSK